MTAQSLDIQTPRVFMPLLRPTRYKGVWGGRGSGKSHFFAELLVEQAAMRPGLRAVCIREIQKSLNMSVKQLVQDKIMRLGLSDQFEVLDKEIRTPGGGRIIFQGMQNHTADSIKSLEGFDVAWVEEAQSLSAHSLKLLRPTIRKPGSEIWFSWNPSQATDPVDAFLRTPEAEADPEILVICANWSDNPWFPDVLDDERRRDQQARPDEYDHIWEGGYQQVTEALIFRNRVEYGCQFETPADARLYYGVDWGFARDPTAVVRCFIADDVLHIDYAEGGVGIEMDGLPALFERVPGTRDWPIKADCARPETISFMANKYGYRISGAKKWQGSVEDGIERLKGFRAIRVHERADKIGREFRSYSYKVDRQTEAILPKIEDANNHWIDACIAEGELVWTDRGHAPIEAVTTADRVMTRWGFKRVLASRMTGENRHVWEISAGGKTLLATAEHRVFTCNRGFVRVDELRLTDTLLLEATPCQKSGSKPPFMTARFTEDTPEASGAQMPFISSAPSRRANASICTGAYGKTITGQSPKGSIFTTVMMTLATTPRKIWKRFLSPIISRDTRPLPSSERGKNSTSPRYGTSQRTGTHPRLGARSISALALWLMLASRALRRPALIVGAPSHAGRSGTRTNSAPTLASQHGGGTRALMMSREAACIAARSLPPTSTAGSAFVAAPVSSITAGKYVSRRVYDLTVDECPEFFASGVLVHNCRYALDGLIQNRRAMPDFSQYASQPIIKRSFI